MKDGSTYKGSFVNGEIQGKGQRVYECGMTYDGDWIQGERDGYGECKYGRRNYTDTHYKGEWKLNMRHGHGEMGLKNGAIIKGNFVNNYPEGLCTIIYSDGQSYTGNLVKGTPNGLGTQTKNGIVYQGNFEGGMRQGEGTISISGSNYTLQSSFSNDKPSYECNKFTCEILSPKLEEVIVDLKAKAVKDAPKPVSKFTESEEAKYKDNKIFYEYKRPVPSAEEGGEESLGLLPNIKIKL